MLYFRQLAHSTYHNIIIQCINDNVIHEAKYKTYRLQPIINTTFMVKKQNRL